jgi:DNA-binding response OmpR family regulator
MDTQPPVVVIEDEAPLLGLIRELLALDGYPSRCFHAGYEVKRDQLGAALFLIDLMLPGESGIEVAHRLRLDGHGSTPMIAMSASDVLLERAAASGLFDETLKKPFDAAQLLERVAQYVGRLEPAPAEGVSA